MNESNRRVRVLVVDDDACTRSGLENLLEQVGFVVDTAEDGVAALALAGERPPDIIVTDLKMPNLDGIGLLAKVRQQRSPPPVIVVTAMGDIAAAIAAMRAGAEDYLTKPVDFDALLISIERGLERQALRSEAETLRSELRQREGGGLGGLLGTSPAMQRLYRVVRKVAGARATVLITGESGTGKGELARAIHSLGPRAKGPFVALHCAALAESLLESELFGYERGAFTGADKRRIGRFEQAHGGTLFLDEVAEIPMATQVKLLRFLQERAFERVGGNETIEVEVRVVAATNRDLAADVQEGRFREDLYYRLNVVHLDVPPLRLRELDTLLLASHFLRRFAADNHRTIEGFSDRARAKLVAHRWPGNVRELENAIERAVVLCEGNRIEEHHLPFDVAPIARGSLRAPGSTMAEIERFAILSALEATGGSTTKAAEMLDISIRTIQYRSTTMVSRRRSARRTKTDRRALRRCNPLLVRLQRDDAATAPDAHEPRGEREAPANDGAPGGWHVFCEEGEDVTRTIRTRRGLRRAPRKHLDGGSAGSGRPRRVRGRHPPRPPDRNRDVKHFVVLAAIDFSASSEAVAHEAIELAATHPRSELHFVTVQQTTLELMAAPHDELRSPVAALRVVADKAVRHFEGCHAISPIERVLVHATVGDPASEIVALAAGLDADLVVLGTQGRRGIPRVIHGSVAEKVVRTAGCPVYVTRKKAHPEALEAPEVEPLCRECAATRTTSGGRELWCTHHADHHQRAHVYAHDESGVREAALSGHST